MESIPPALPPVQPGDFLPIQRDELVAGAQEVRRSSGWILFGRRDIIPPVTDPRTLLIDRGMMMQGFLTADELAEIHTVGEEYNRFTNREEFIRVQAGKSADQAVEADRAARAEKKARKKAEAAEKKKKRAEEVTARKQNDIIFVGKGVSAQLIDRVSDLARLEAANLPQISTPAELAGMLGLTVSKLRWLCYHSEVMTRIHYVQFEVKKKTGGVRVLSAPHQMLATAQEWILTRILNRLPTEESAHGFVAGRSTLSNALPHLKKEMLVNFDLEGFFPSIGFARVRHLFRRLGYSGAVATLLALLCTECPRKKVVYNNTVYFVAMGPRGLPQGACTSPAISNQIARKLDRRFMALSGKLNLSYTRYADDLTFSASQELSTQLGYLMARVRHITDDEGFAINRKKTRVKRRNSRQTVTGLVVNESASLPRDLLKRIRAILHKAKTEGLDAQNREQLPNFRAWLSGMIAYVQMVKPQLGEKFKQALTEIESSEKK
jgi:retron-type reverse transcriptase